MATQEMTETRISIAAALPATRTRLQPAPSGVLSQDYLLLAALLGSGLLWLCYFPAACGWLAWVALVPFLTLVRNRSMRYDIYFTAYGAGLYFFVPALQWMRVADPRMYYTWIGLSIYCAAYFPLAIFLLR